METTYQRIRIERRDSVCLIWLAYPERLNALDLVMREELRRALAEIGEEEDLRALVILGEGGNFCAGGDIRTMDVRDPAAGRKRVRRVGGLITRMREIPQPIVAAVDGVATGAGLGLALACDLIVASQKARFAVGQTKIALVPDLGLTRHLILRIGWTRAAEMMMTGAFIDAQKALEWGLVNRIVPQEFLLDEAMKLATEIAAGPPMVLSMLKEVFTRSPLGLEEALGREADMQALAFLTEDFKEGREAILEKRSPRFRGR